MPGRVRLGCEEQFLLQNGGQVLAQGVGGSPSLRVSQIRGDVELREAVSGRGGAGGGSWRPFGTE